MIKNIVVCIIIIYNIVVFIFNLHYLCIFAYWVTFVHLATEKSFYGKKIFTNLHVCIVLIMC